MIATILHMIVALVSFELLSGPGQYHLGRVILGAVLTIALMVLLGGFRVRMLLKKLRSMYPIDDLRAQAEFERFRSGFQMTCTAAYVTILMVGQWGVMVRSVFSGWILIDTLMGILPFLILLVVNWSLAYVFHNNISSEKWSFRGYLIFNAQMTLAPIVPFLILNSLLSSLYYLPYPWSVWLGSGGAGELLILILLLAAVGFVFPVILVRIWGCRSMPKDSRRHLLEAVCRARKLEYRDILLWDIGEGKFLNAGIMGISKHFRYILFSRKLLASMSDEELIAVLGHEIGHSKKHHIALNIVISFGFLSFFMLLSQVTLTIMSRLQMSEGTIVFAMFGLTIGGILFYWRIIFGYISRQFERQADLYGVETVGSTAPMIAALERLAIASGRPRSHPSWTHYSIADRVTFLERVERNQNVARDFVRQTTFLIKRLVVTAVILLVVSMISNAAMLSGIPPLERWYADERYEEIELYLTAQIDAGVDDLMVMANNYNDLAWLYAVSKDEAYRRPMDALFYSGQAVSITRDQINAGVFSENPPVAFALLGMYIDTLAAAYYALGDNEAALYYSEMALELYPSEVPSVKELRNNHRKYKRAVKEGDSQI